MIHNIKAFFHKYIYGLTLVNKVIKGKKLHFYLLLCIALFASFFENLGFSMIIPLVESIMGNTYNSKFSFFMKPLLQYVTKNRAIFIIISMFTGMIIIKSILNMIRVRTGYNLAFNIRHTLRTQLFEKYILSRYDYLIKNQQGVIFHNIIVEPQQVSHVVLQLIDLFVYTINIVIIYSILLIASYQMTIALTVIVVLLTTIMLFFGNSIVNRLVKERIKKQQLFSSICSESFASAKQVKVYHLENKQIEKFNQFSGYERNINSDVQFISTIPTVIAQPILIIILFIIAGYIIFFSKVDLNGIVPILTLFLMISQPLLNSVASVSQNRLALESLAPSLSLIMKLLDNEIKSEDISGTEEFTELKKDIIFNNVQFKYEPSKYIFKNLNMVIPIGKMTALIGPSGVGKSTIADLLSGLYFPEKGEILINNIDTKKYDIYSLRKRISYVSQDTILFHETIRENVLISKPDATDQEVIRALEMAHCMEFVNILPQGIDTIVGDKGVMLSGGQRQRIAIARAILRDPEIFIFDEATSALDNESEKLIQQSIEDLSRIKTIVVIAHRLTTIENADVVYDLGKMEL